MQIAKLYGAEVTGVDNSEKQNMMQSIGFDHVIDYTKRDFTKNEQFYDLILDAKTTHSVFDYLHILKPNGTYVTVGGSSLRVLQAFILGPWIFMFIKKNIRLVMLKPNKDLDYINEHFKADKIKPVIDRLYKLSEVPDAIRYFGEGKHKGKVVITIA